MLFITLAAGYGKGSVLFWFKYPPQQCVSSVKGGDYDTGSPDKTWKHMFHTVLGLPFSVATCESKRGSRLFASRDPKRPHQISFGKFVTLA